MPRNGSGNFNLVTNSWWPPVNGTPATAADWQSLIEDVAAALTQSVSRDGQTPILQNLPMGGNKLTGLSAGTAAGDSLRYEQLFSQGQPQNLASAATTDIGAQLTTNLNITGTNTITSFGVNYNGPRFLRFNGALTLTHSATLVLPGGVNIQTASGDVAIVIPIGTPAAGWAVVSYQNQSPTGRLLAVRVFGAPGVSTYTPTAGTRYIVAEVVGGGGAGGGALATNASQASIGGGGGGGAYSRKFINSGFSGVSITVGSGGAGVSGQSGSGGGASSFGAVLSSPGGQGGQRVGPDGGLFLLGSGGSPSAIASGGDVNGAGTGGEQSWVHGSLNTIFGGKGGGSFFGSGAARAGSGAGIAGPTPGSGGSGATNATSQASNFAGGSGAPGMVLIWEYA